MTLPAGRPRRRRWGWALLIAAFVAVPLLEIWTILRVGQAIGAWWTIGLLVADSILGSWLIKREGGRAWAALRQALQSGRMPARELADGALILVGGTLMLSPGFVTDAFALLLILPFTRPLARSFLTRLVEKRILGPSHHRRPGPPGSGPVIRGDVVDEP